MRHRILLLVAGLIVIVGLIAWDNRQALATCLEQYDHDTCIGMRK